MLKNKQKFEKIENVVSYSSFSLLRGSPLKMLLNALNTF